VRTQIYLEYLQDADAQNSESVRQGLKEITGTERAALSEAYEGKPELVVNIEDGIIIDDCLSVCKYFGGSFQGIVPKKEWHLPGLISAGMGIEMSEEMLFDIARRVKNLERAYCVREGMTRQTDSLPKGWMDSPIDRGNFKGVMLDSSKFEEMKNRYYAIREWDIETGIPTRKTLERSGLGGIADDLEKRGMLPRYQ
jgi:aldehyde:ferredoxin oxidoreductase